MTMEYLPGDSIWISQQGASLLSMAYYAEHAKEIKCPCKHRNTLGTVIKMQGHFVYVRLADETITAYHVSDIRLIRKDLED